MFTIYAGAFALGSRHLELDVCIVSWCRCLVLSLSGRYSRFVVVVVAFVPSGS